MLDFYNSKYQKIFLTDDGIFVQQWYEATEFMKEKEFMAEMEKMRSIVEEQSVKKPLLIDMRDFKFLVTPELQDWVNENINAKIAHSVSKVAFVVSPYFFTQVSVKQTLDDDRFLIKQFFDDIDKAYEWLKN